MHQKVPIAVGIPTYHRGERVLQVLQRLQACDPAPAEILVFLDAGDDALEHRIHEAFPAVKILSSAERVGPGGGRHRMLQVATQPWLVSLDDDSWPVDVDFFARLQRHIEAADDVAVLATVIHHQEQEAPALGSWVHTVSDYTGCGHAMRVTAYRELTGYVDRPHAYGLEERDVALQLHCTGWRVHRCGDLRVFHDTRLRHHQQPSVVAATVENAALLAWLRYPLILWPYGLLQFANVICFMISCGRLRGILHGMLNAPVELWRHRHLRRPLPAKLVISYLRLRHQPPSQ
ncbi:glycosyltransferase [Prosthecobacter sp.]|uniref:glycosyltransferase family 2 protein n=1 Tax=Prosthecobacter sp. TaxID=1965333 RepID=UPI001DDE78D9|nr:glycosyltransferase [Prosthecobacter sp.]MCB1276975.1 glycosyltransferase [Prosthecobacter sp.]